MRRFPGPDLFTVLFLCLSCQPGTETSETVSHNKFLQVTGVGHFVSMTRTVTNTCCENIVRLLLNDYFLGSQNIPAILTSPAFALDLTLPVSLPHHPSLTFSLNTAGNLHALPIPAQWLLFVLLCQFPSISDR